MYEASLALEKYLEHRKEHCEIITNLKDKSKRRLVKRVTANSIRQYYNRFVFNRYKTERKKGHEFSVHGFRKYFKARAEQSEMKPINIEMLMGHSIGISIHTTSQ